MLGLIASVAYGTAAYYAPSHHTQKLMGLCAGLSLSILPYTLVVIMPSVNALFALDSSGDVAKVNSEGDKLIDKWNKLSVSRAAIAAIPLLIAFKEISE
jgi:hypothetical protein